MTIRIFSLILTTFAAGLCNITTASELEQLDVQTLVSDGITLHDQRRYDDAIAHYEAALLIDPSSALAAYELALTFQTTGDLPACIETASDALQRSEENDVKDVYVSGLYTMLASCHSASGSTENALEVFRDGLKRFPNHFGLHLNISVTLANSGDSEGAKDHLGAAMALDPSHPSPYFMLGEHLRLEGKRSEALLAYMVFLQYESDTERSFQAAVNLINSMYAPKNDDEPPAIVVDARDRPIDGYFGLQLAYFAGKIERISDDKFVEPLSENVASALHVFMTLAAAVEFDSVDADIIVRHVMPSIVRIVEADSAEPFAWFVVYLSRMPGAREWLDAHSDEVAQLNALLNSIDDSSQQ